MNTMRAMLVREYGAPEVIRFEPVETAKPGAGEVLVEIRAVTVNRKRGILEAE